MSDIVDLPEAVRGYLDELSYELRFEQKYAAEICDEIGGHFSEALACSGNPDSRQAAAELTRGFGSPQFLAADFAAVLMTRKLRNSLLLDLGIMLFIALAVISCLSASHQAVSLLLAGIPGMVAWGSLQWVRVKNINGSKLYHWLCTPMIACHITSLLLVIALLRDLFFSAHSSVFYAGFELIAVGVLAGRFFYLKKQSRMMCLLWQKVSRQDCV